ncbi:hypothetical protein [Burkholderia pseudomultivorans]|uniref:hypothetical protein n=1 Tax=Burkholderia pseudomultivorans TaxID=1207504 RepID=UPI0001FDABEB|nr:hypothetical protein [Burkholderia pseudomultivorans]EGD05226.1 hypothetical protein B1M_07467 [Burkholderia sp. TJI49]
MNRTHCANSKSPGGRPIVEAHGGALSAAPHADRETVPTFWLPLSTTQRSGETA